MPNTLDDLFHSRLFCNLYQSTSGFGETLEADCSASALEPMGELGQFGQVCLLVRGLHFRESFLHPSGVSRNSSIRGD